MYRRITHWSTLGFLRNLGGLEERRLRDIFRKHSHNLPRSTRRDTALCNELRNIEAEGMLSTVMSSHPVKPTPEPRRLMATLLEVQSSPNQVEGLGAYTEETCFEFHQLLIAAIFGFGKALRSLHDHRKLSYVERSRYIQVVVQFGNLLWRIAFSRILGHHLTLLQSGSFLSIPNRDEEESCRTYAFFAPPLKAASKRPKYSREQPTEVIDGGEVRGKEAETEAKQQEMGDREGEAETETGMGDKGDREGEAETETGKEGAGNCEGEAENVGETEAGGHKGETETKTRKEGVGDCEGDAENVSEAEERQNEEEDDFGAEVQRMIQALPINEPDGDKAPPTMISLDKTAAGKALMFQRWLRLLVNHWAALDIISAHGSKSSHDIQVKLVTAKHPDTYADKGMAMNPWRDTIRRLAAYLESHPESLEPETQFDAELCISLLEKYLKDKTPYHSLMTAFNYDRDDPNKFPGTYHCEAILAAIIYLGVHPKEGFPDLLGEV